MLKNIQLNIDSRLEKLYNLTFKGQTEKVFKMSEQEKLEVIQEIDETRLALYDHMALFDQYSTDQGFPRPLCSAEEFMFCESKVKRLEILLNTILGINDQLDEMETYEKATEAERQLHANEITQAKYNSIMADINQVHRQASVADAIQQQAAELTAKYYGKRG